jgi:hypothetical protein
MAAALFDRQGWKKRGEKVEKRRKVEEKEKKILKTWLIIIHI